MKKSYFLIGKSIILIILISIFSFVGCTKDEDKTETGGIMIIFDNSVKDVPLEYGKFIYDCEAGYKYKVTTLRYFTSMFKLYNTDGNSVNLDTFHYRDADSDYEYTHSLVINNVPVGTYNGLSFIHGLDDTYNKPIIGSEPHSLPNKDEYLDMYWPWQEDGQYHYMKYEGAYEFENADSMELLSFKLHTGPTSGNDNYINIDKISFDDIELTEGKMLEIHLNLDLNQWLENPIVYDFNVFGKGIMRNQDAQDILKANGKSVYSIKKVELVDYDK